MPSAGYVVKLKHNLIDNIDGQTFCFSQCKELTAQPACDQPRHDSRTAVANDAGNVVRADTFVLIANASRRWRLVSGDGLRSKNWSGIKRTCGCRADASDDVRGAGASTDWDRSSLRSVADRAPRRICWW